MVISKTLNISAFKPFFKRNLAPSLSFFNYGSIGPLLIDEFNCSKN